MATPKVCVLRAPGTNCDVETAHAFEISGADTQRVHLFRLLEDPGLLRNFQVLCIPGGFSYGDDIGAGVIFSRQLQSRLSEALGEFLEADKLVLGICNGFQVLLKAGILPGTAGRKLQAEPQPAAKATLTWNDNGRYTALWVRLSVVAHQNVFLRGIDTLELPIAHAEGKIVVGDERLLKDWQEGGQIALCYCAADENGDTRDNKNGLGVQLPYPANPNGSVANIAGFGDSEGRVLGLMPHPERFIHATQHPQWTRQRLSGEGCGLKLFQNAVEYFR